MQTSRRRFIAGAGLMGLMPTASVWTETPSEGVAAVRFGLVSDLHYGDIPDETAPFEVGGQRFCRESKRKLAEAVRVFNARKVDFAIELGDFKDFSHDRVGTIAHLEDIERTFAGFNGPRYHAFGNHDFDCLTPEDLAPRLLNDGQPMTRGYYSFVKKGVTFIVLDACYDSGLKHYACNNPWFDSNVPAEELDWLKRILAAAPGSAVVFCHQRLDPSASPRHLVRNAAAVREILEKSGKVKSVFTGHQHMGSVFDHNGIIYYSIIAQALDSGPRANSFAEVAIAPDGSMRVTGYLNAVSYGSAKGDPMDF